MKLEILLASLRAQPRCLVTVGRCARVARTPSRPKISARSTHTEPSGPTTPAQRSCSPLPPSPPAVPRSTRRPGSRSAGKTPAPVTVAAIANASARLSRRTPPDAPRQALLPSGGRRNFAVRTISVLYMMKMLTKILFLMRCSHAVRAGMDLFAVHPNVSCEDLRQWSFFLLRHQDLQRGALRRRF